MPGKKGIVLFVLHLIDRSQMLLATTGIMELYLQVVAPPAKIFGKIVDATRF